MLSNLQPIGERAVLLGWGSSEATTRLLNAGLISIDLGQKISDRAKLSDDESEQLINAIKYVRGPLLQWFLNHPTDWFRAEIQVTEIGSIGTIYFAERTIGDLIKNQTKIKSITGFDLGKMRGLPILVGPAREGPYRLIDGANRCCNILRMADATRPMVIEILLGVCLSVETWHLWR